MDLYVAAWETVPRYLVVPLKLVVHSVHHYATVVGGSGNNTECTLLEDLCFDLESASGDE